MLKFPPATFFLIAFGLIAPGVMLVPLMSEAPSAVSSFMVPTTLIFLLAVVFHRNMNNHQHGNGANGVRPGEKRPFFPYVRYDSNRSHQTFAATSGGHVSRYAGQIRLLISDQGVLAVAPAD